VNARRWWAGVVVTAAVVTLGGCTSATSQLQQEAVRAHENVNAAVGPYLAMPGPGAGEWDVFLSDGRLLVERLVAAFEDFSAATDALVAADDADADTYRRYRDLLGRWVTSQQVQLVVAERCIPDPDPGRCFTTALSADDVVVGDADLREMQQLSAQLYGR